MSTESREGEEEEEKREGRKETETAYKVKHRKKSNALMEWSGGFTLMATTDSLSLSLSLSFPEKVIMYEPRCVQVLPHDLAVARRPTIDLLISN